MRQISRRRFLKQAVCGAAAVAGMTASARARAAATPNIVVILADDLGYGDVQAYNPESKVPTPHLNRLAEQGMRFLDAHTPSAVCTPTRYGLLTGRYAWRTELKSGVLHGFSPPLIEKDRQTVAKVLQDAGYHTGVVGKWHLGIDWPRAHHSAPLEVAGQGYDVAPAEGVVDYTRAAPHGPREAGFDFSHIFPASLDMAPYVYVENNKATSLPTKIEPGGKFPAFRRKGAAGEDFVLNEALDHLLGEAQGYIERRAEEEAPFFLYFPLTAPHKPVIPTERFAGKSGLGPYADFIMQVDWTVGQVMKTLEETGAAENTLLIVTSDNGSFMNRFDEERKDHLDDPSIEGYWRAHHKANWNWRGRKTDIWEAGHRVPFIARWPGHVAPGSTAEATISLTDFLATAAAIVDEPFGRQASPDSYSFLPVLRGEPGQHKRPPVIHHSVSGIFAIREGDMKLVLGSGSGGREQPRGKPFEQPYKLFNIAEDPAEEQNLIEERPEVAARLMEAFYEIAGDDVPPPTQET